MQKENKPMEKKSAITPFQHPRGMHDILPAEEPYWDKVRRAAGEIADFYNFVRMKTPLLERAELFEHAVGAETDIVEKQMFIVKTKSKERLALRPEGTAPLVRAFIEHSLGEQGLPLKVFREGAVYRYERPQAGRTREFYQLDFDVLSSEDDPIYDAQIILVFTRLLESLKLRNLKIAVNSIGCASCRPAYRKQLQNFYRNVKQTLCADCVRRLETNPLRLLDCKEEKCRERRKEAPIIIDHLCSSCHNHFKAVLEYLEELALPYQLDHYLVRGLDYYTKTVFELFAENVDFALGGGGRYDTLAELLGGKSTPAVGGAAGAERMIDAMKLQNIQVNPRTRPKIFLIYIGELAKRKSLRLIEELRRSRIDVAESLGKESLKAQLRQADKMGSPLALIFGQKEAFEESIIMRDLASGVQETVPLVKMAEAIKKKLK